jgi:cytochrome b561
MAVLLVGHIGAALYHHFVRQDDVLQRMLRGEVAS